MVLYRVKEQIKVNQFSLLLRTNKWSIGKGSGLQSTIFKFNSRRSLFLDVEKGSLIIQCSGPVIIYGWGGGRRENGGVTKKLGMTGVG